MSIDGYLKNRSDRSCSFNDVIKMRKVNPGANNLALAQDLYNLVEESTIKKIQVARSILRSADGTYEFKDVKSGKYIIGATRMGGTIIKFDISSDSYTRKKIPDMPADYYYKNLAKEKYVQKN